VTRLEEGVALYRDLLGGDERARQDNWVEFAWSSGGVIRVFERRDAPQGVNHVSFTTVDPAAIADAKPTGEGTYEIAPEANLGVRLRLRDAAA
jgi:hypothetical protein